MVACPPDDTMDRDRIMGHQQNEDEEDPSTMAATDTDTAPIDLNQDSAWPTAEGYTPLGDIQHLVSLLMAMPPDEEEHGHFYAPNSFVADPGALFGGINNATTTHDDDNDATDNPEEDTANYSSLNSTNNNTGDGFRDVASSALMALENDYEMTLRGEVRPSLMDSQPPALGGPSMPLFDTNSLNNNNNDATNFADFESAEISIGTPSPQKPLPKIDAAAVQKAVAGITSNTSLQAKLQKWQTEKQTKKHSLIPAAPLKAFAPSRKTPKAIEATFNLSRSATIAESLHRLSHLLQCQDRLSIHLVGADYVECQSAVRVQSVLAPLVRWIGANLYAPRHLQVVLIGPNVPTNMSSSTPIPLLSAQQQQLSTQRLHTATALCQEASYHDWLTEENRPDLVVCFNAGIWGYDEWKPTIRALVQYPAKIPVVVTSYTIEEAEDDHDVIQEVVVEESAADTEASPKPPCLWGPEANYFGSKQKRETVTAVEGREYRENAAWQAWKL